MKIRDLEMNRVLTHHVRFESLRREFDPKDGGQETVEGFRARRKAVIRKMEALLEEVAVLGSKGQSLHKQILNFLDKHREEDSDEELGRLLRKAALAGESSRKKENEKKNDVLSGRSLMDLIRDRENERDYAPSTAHGEGPGRKKGRGGSKPPFSPPGFPRP